MAHPDVSVLLPVRDGGAWLDEALGSVASQTLESLEVVVVDDGSVDDTPDRLEAWARRDPRIRVLRQEPSGIVVALERARADARGRFLARMDADDVAMPERLEAQLALMEAGSRLAACGCGVEYFPREAVRDGARRYEAWVNRATTPEAIAAAIFVECPLAHPTFFLRADAVEATGGYRDAGWAEDYDLLLRLWRAGYRLGKVADVLLRWRERPDRLSRTHPAYAPQAFVACKVHHLRRSLLRGGRSCVVWGAGPVGKRFARALQKAGTEVEAFVDLDPRKIGQEVHAAPVLDLADGLRMRGPLHLGAVGQKGARARIREALGGAGFRELDDFVAVA